MKTLNFRKDSIEPILSGDRTKTLRSRTTVEVGGIAAARCRRDGPPFALLEVTAIRRLEVASIESDFARQERIARLYPGAGELLEISFRTVSDSTVNSPPIDPVRPPQASSKQDREQEPASRVRQRLP